jgi:hypothetical protein
MTLPQCRLLVSLRQNTRAVNLSLFPAVAHDHVRQYGLARGRRGEVLSGHVRSQVLSCEWATVP